MDVDAPTKNEPDDKDSVAAALILLLQHQRSHYELCRTGEGRENEKLVVDLALVTYQKMLQNC